MNDYDTFTTRLWHTSKFVYMFVSHFQVTIFWLTVIIYVEKRYFWDSRERIDIPSFKKKKKTNLRAKEIKKNKWDLW